METASSVNFTLSELLQISLGANNFKAENIYVLQNVFKIILKKLNCQNEVVKINGMPATCLQELQKHAVDSPYKLNCETEEPLDIKYAKISKLQKDFLQMQLKYQDHVQQIKKCHATKIFSPRYWDYYCSGTEDTCTFSINTLINPCKAIISNAHFNEVLRKHVTVAVVKKIMHLEENINDLRDTLKSVQENFNNFNNKLDLLIEIKAELDRNRTAIQEQQKIFYSTMKELQVIFFCKLNRVHFPVLRKYMDKIFVEIENYLKDFKKKQSVQFRDRLYDATIPEVGKQSCLSCAILKQFKPMSRLKLQKWRSKPCQCINIFESPNLLRKLERITQKLPKIKESLRRLKTHHGPHNKFYTEKSIFQIVQSESAADSTLDAPLKFNVRRISDFGDQKGVPTFKRTSLNI